MKMNQKAKPNPWVWTEKAESKMPDRKAGGNDTYRIPY
ncbi:hypothetical protein HWB73_gp38 [Paenibacillus phage Eltigre]|uniref:Uncharacterized protein n=3 Tax=Fernvirus TaxID=2843380 RepID=A0A345AT85_9CAUD|nr:hypothetical protein HWB73_gp38 [Paenibacillus phage Eltigre]AXF40118.1 hypothetical protein ELTIGRE_38 [Paenibacillus phage Eltigre]